MLTARTSRHLNPLSQKAVDVLYSVGKGIYVDPGWLLVPCWWRGDGCHPLITTGGMCICIYIYIYECSPRLHLSIPLSSCLLHGAWATHVTRNNPLTRDVHSEKTITL